MPSLQALSILIKKAKKAKGESHQKGVERLDPPFSKDCEITSDLKRDSGITTCSEETVVQTRTDPGPSRKLISMIDEFCNGPTPFSSSEFPSSAPFASSYPPSPHPFNRHKPLLRDEPTASLEEIQSHRLSDCTTASFQSSASESVSSKDYVSSQVASVSSPGIPLPTAKSPAQRQSIITKRSFIVYELYTTEIVYLKGLKHLALDYMESLLGAPHPPLEKSKARQIFGNLKEIIAFNSEFLNRLEVRLFGNHDHPNSRLEPRPKTDLIWEEDQSIADCLLDFIPFFKAYAAYARQFEASIHILAELQSSSEFMNHLKKLGPNFSLYAFQSLLILPVQRIPRYKLLLQDLLVSSPPISEAPFLELALTEIENLAQFMNESIRRHEKSMEMLKLRKKIIGFQGDFFLPSRFLIKSGTVTKVSRKTRDERFVILFNDFLMLTSKIASNKLLYHRGFDLMDIHAVYTRPDMTNAIEIQADEKSFILIAENFESFQDWKATIQKAIIQHVSRPRPKSIVSIASKESRSYSLPVALPYMARKTAPVWVPDESVDTCYTCKRKFSLLRRRHHCRLCGRIVCFKCSGGVYSIVIEKKDQKVKQRACSLCFGEQITTKFASDPNDWFDGIFEHF